MSPNSFNSLPGGEGSLGGAHDRVKRALCKQLLLLLLFKMPKSEEEAEPRGQLCFLNLPDSFQVEQ